jgi:hypothetical protein
LEAIPEDKNMNEKKTFFSKHRTKESKNRINYSMKELNNGRETRGQEETKIN